MSPGGNKYSLTSSSLSAPWDTWMHSIPFESPTTSNSRKVKSIAALLRYDIHPQNNPYFYSVYIEGGCNLWLYLPVEGARTGGRCAFQATQSHLSHWSWTFIGWRLICTAVISHAMYWARGCLLLDLWRKKCSTVNPRLEVDLSLLD